ncbi:MAG: putative signal transducing protein [Muribaculaceae bacterium]
MEGNSTTDANGLVTIATYNTDWEAHIAQGVLDTHDIESTLGNEVFSSIYPIGFNSLGGVSLNVRACDADRAREVLANHKI